MTIIALDSSDQIFSAALSTDAGLWYAEVDAGARHSELMMECVDSLCKLAQIKPQNIDQAVCMRGPGSFTGLRIGFSAVKGLAMALGIPIAAVPTLDCMAYPLSVWPGLVIPAIDAKKGCFYTALYREGRLLTNYMDANPEILAKETEKARLFKAEPVILTGSGAELLKPLLEERISGNNITVFPGNKRGWARELLEISKSAKLIYMNRNNEGPVYLRKSDAELNTN